MTILGGVTVLFLSLLFMALSLGILFAVLMVYCGILELYNVDPDNGLAFWGFVLITLSGMAMVVWMFVTECIPLMDWIVDQMGLTR